MLCIAKLFIFITSCLKQFLQSKVLKRTLSSQKGNPYTKVYHDKFFFFSQQKVTAIDIDASIASCLEMKLPSCSLHAAEPTHVCKCTLAWHLRMRTLHAHNESVYLPASHFGGLHRENGACVQNVVHNLVHFLSHASFWFKIRRFSSYTSALAWLVLASMGTSLTTF